MSILVMIKEVGELNTDYWPDYSLPLQADFRQPDFQQAFFGVNYHKLQAIKAKYDPDDLFYALTAVNSDQWAEQQDGRLCKV